MDKAKHSLENQNFSLWPKPSDNENASDVGWLLYSTRNQGEERLAALLSTKTGENIGVKWKPIRTSMRSNKKKDADDSSERIFALHLECATERLQDVCKKMSVWYDSFPRFFQIEQKWGLSLPLHLSCLLTTRLSLPHVRLIKWH